MRKRNPATPLLGLMVVGLASSAAGQTAAEGARTAAQEAQWAQEAQGAEEAGHYSAAADALSPLAERYPEDYALRLRIAWDLYRADRFAAALAHYRAAVDLSGGTSESHLGMGWTLLSLDRCREAEAHWALARDGPNEAALAEEGADICHRRIGTRLAAEAGAVGHLYRDHPTLLAAVGGFAAVDAVIKGSFLAGATYRLMSFESEGASGGPGPGPGGPSAQSIFTLQQELHGRAGWRWASGDVTVAYGYVWSQGSPVLASLHAPGLLLRLRAYGELGVEASAALGDGVEVLRLAPSWWLPLTPWLSLRPGAIVQGILNDGVYGAGQLTLLVHGDPGALWVGGRAGIQYYPVSIERSVIYNIADAIREGFWAGGSVTLGAGLTLRLDYELQRRLVPVADGREQEAWVHYGVLRLRWEST